MYEIFNERTAKRNRGLQKFAAFNYISGILEQEKTKAIKYYRNFPTHISTGHFLVKLVESIVVGFNDEPQTHFDKVSDMALNYAMSMGLTSSIHKGKVFKEGVMFKKWTNEIIIAIDDNDYDLSDIINTWQDLRPIRFLHHELTDTLMPLIKGPQSRYGDESEDIGFAVTEINIPLLSLQYQMWRRANNHKRSGDFGTIGQFLISYPLANALHSFVDIAIFNRLKNNTYKLPNPKSRNYNPFPVITMEDRMEKVFTDINQLIIKNRMNFLDILDFVPIVDSLNLNELLELPKIPATRQITWALDIARLPTIAWLLAINEVSNSANNGQYINYIQRSLRNIKSDATFRNTLPTLDYLKLTQYLDDYIKPLV